MRTHHMVINQVEFYKHDQNIIAVHSQISPWNVPTILSVQKYVPLRLAMPKQDLEVEFCSLRYGVGDIRFILI